MKSIAIYDKFVLGFQFSVLSFQPMNLFFYTYCLIVFEDRLELVDYPNEIPPCVPDMHRDRRDPCPDVCQEVRL